MLFETIVGGIIAGLAVALIKRFLFARQQARLNDTNMPDASLHHFSLDTEKFDKLLREIKSCERVEQFIEMYEAGTVCCCLDLIKTAHRKSGKTVEAWAECWAKSLFRNDEDAKTLNRARKLSLELLYTLLNRWKGWKKCESTLSAENVIDFGDKRIMGILRLCLPMDRANALYNMTLPGESQPGMHWVSEIHIARDPVWAERMNDYGGIPTMNKRYLWLIEEKDLAGLKLSDNNFMREFTTPKEMPDSGQVGLCSTL